MADDILEQTESFNVTLSSNHRDVVFNVSEITVSIDEDGGEKVLNTEVYTTSLFPVQQQS